MFFLPSPVKPELDDMSIWLYDIDQLIQLFNHIFVVGCIQSFILYICIHLTVPQWIVQAQAYIIFFASLGYLFYHVRFIPRISHIIFGIFAIPKTEAFMMFGYQYDIFHAGIFSCFDPLIGIDSCRAIRGSRLWAIRPFLIMECINTKMNKHPILPGNLFLLCRTGLVRRDR